MCCCMKKTAVKSLRYYSFLQQETNRDNDKTMTSASVNCSYFCCWNGTNTVEVAKLNFVEEMSSIAYLRIDYFKESLIDLVPILNQ